MQTESEIKEKLNEYYDHRLVLRVKRLLRRSFRNCQHNKRVSMEEGNGEFEGRFGLCMNPEVTGADDAVLKCGSEREKGCKCYKAKYTSREQVKAEFDAELRDPKIAGQREPKIAVLLWVLHAGAEPCLSGRQGGTRWKKAYLWLRKLILGKDGSASV